jgi:hypothetical protein
MAYNRSKGYYTIEQNGHGATYCEKGFTIYKISTYPRTSVLAGQQCRQWLANFETLAEAMRAYPEAEHIEGTTYQDIDTMVAHLPDEDD